MLTAFQSRGDRPPLFLGLYGLYTSDRGLAADLGRDQPLYGISARGFDGAAPPCQTVPQMAALYAAEISALRPARPLRLGGMCLGSKAAVETARVLVAMGRTVGPVLLIDPAVTPLKPRSTIERFTLGAALPGARDQIDALLRQIIRNQAIAMTNRLFDCDDPSALKVAAAVAAATSQALSQFEPEPFGGATELVLCSRRAENFFAPHHPWQTYLHGPRATHVIEGEHMELLSTHQKQIHRLIRRSLLA